MDKLQFISVAMGVLYRRDDLGLLQRSVESILNQSYRNFEFLICDDGSAPKAKRMLEEYSARDRRIRLIRPGGKLDLASKLNACLKQAKGGYIARMDDDDYSRPDRFERQLAALAANPNISFVGSNVRLWCGQSIIGRRVFPSYPQVRDFYMTQPFIHSALMFRRAPLIEVGGYSEARQQVLCEDYDLLLRLYARGYVGMNLEDPLLDYSIPADGKGNRRMKHRWNETVTRYQRFCELHLLPAALPYVIKPIAVGLLPKKMLMKMKNRTL